MFRRKLPSAAPLLRVLIRSNLRNVRAAFPRPLATLRELARAAGRLASLITLLKKGDRAAKLVRLCRASGATPEELARNPHAAFLTATELIDQKRFEEVPAVLNPAIEADPTSAKCYALRAVAGLWTGRVRESLADYERAAALNPQLARERSDHISRAYLLGNLGREVEARTALAAQFDIADAPEALARFLADRVRPHVERRGLRGSVGVFFGGFGNAVGHAVLDPFHFVQLFRRKFDALVIVHPVRGGATPVATELLDPHVFTLEADLPELAGLTWLHAGEVRHENLTFLLHNYWSLNRLAFRARTDAAHPLARDYLRLPPKLGRLAVGQCRRMGIDPERPTVVLHTREHGYHALGVQAFRNTDVRTYVPALRKLIALGCQVVRVGDAKMHSIRDDVPGLLELPLLEGYDPVLDVYFLSRCVFMISCQSGPCSFARAFGKPSLVLNAVYHYTLLPESRELIAFKKYRDADSRELGLDELLSRGVQSFDRTEHFDRAGIVLEGMSSEEIVAATDEMLGWLADPNRAESESQMRFRQLMREHAAGDHALADYIGYALPECRVSDAVCRMRLGYVEVPQTNRVEQLQPA